MAISFNEVSPNLRVPGLYVEIDGTGAAAGQGGQPYKVLLLGQRRSTGTVAANVPTRITSAGAAVQAFGAGSMLAAMATSFLAGNRFTELWVTAMDDPGAGVAASATIGCATSSAVAGTAYLYVAGVRIQVGVTAGMAPAALATAIAAAINGTAGLPVSAAVNGGDDTQVDLTCVHAGTIGNELDLRVNHFDGETTPSGVTLTLTGFSSGSGTPDLTSALAALGDEWFNLMACPYTDAALLTVLEAELADRFSASRMIDGVGFSATSVSHSAAGTLGDGRNSPHVSIMSTTGSPTPPWTWAAAVTAQVAASAERDPARPFQTLKLPGVLAPRIEDRHTEQERNLLLYDGIATHRVDAGGSALIERLVTTYAENGLGAPDVAFLDVNTLLTVSRLRYDLRQRFGVKYPRHKLADDDARFGPGQAILTPKVAKAEVIALFEEWEEQGWVEGIKQFTQDLIVERNAEDVNRLDIRLSPDLVNQLRVVGAQVSFLL